MNESHLVADQKTILRLTLQSTESFNIPLVTLRHKVLASLKKSISEKKCKDSFCVCVCVH